MDELNVCELIRSLKRNTAEQSLPAGNLRVASPVGVALADAIWERLHAAGFGVTSNFCGGSELGSLCGSRFVPHVHQCIR